MPYHAGATIKHGTSGNTKFMVCSLFFAEQHTPGGCFVAGHTMSAFTHSKDMTVRLQRAWQLAGPVLIAQSSINDSLGQEEDSADKVW
jgi:hypothetical protein